MAIEADQELKEWIIRIKEVFELTPPDRIRCIYKVPENLRQRNERAYIPRYISIGPFHHGREILTEMEKQKSIYLIEFQKRFNCESVELEKFFRIIRTKEEYIRSCYSGSALMFSSSEFVQMILCDAVFIIELFLRFCEQEKYILHNDAVLSRPWLHKGIQQDLMILENQIPYFILEELYNLAFHTRDDNCPAFLDLCCAFLQVPISTKKVVIEKTIKIQHFTDLLRCRMIISHQFKRGAAVTHLPAAANLLEAGIRFKNTATDDSFLDIKFERRELQIPRFEVRDNTDCTIRNLMALEQCHYPYETYICNYIKLMSFLINDRKDLDLLIYKRIIVNGRGDDYAVTSFFNELAQDITELNSCYAEIAENLNAHYDSFVTRIDGFWTRNWEILKRVYFTNLWRSTQTVAAVLILVLTFMQTVKAFK